MQVAWLQRGFQLQHFGDFGVSFIATVAQLYERQSITSTIVAANELEHHRLSTSTIAVIVIDLVTFSYILSRFAPVPMASHDHRDAASPAQATKSRSDAVHVRARLGARVR